MKILLLNSPRKYWPYINEEDNFILPQWMPTIGAIARQEGHQVECLDCMVSKVGWQSLARLVKEKRPDVVGINESHTLYIHEAAKLATLVRENSPNTIIVGGGVHMTNCASQIVQDFELDFIVRGEGEIIFKNLLKEIEKINPNYYNVKGVTWKDHEEIITNPPEALIQNLDDLPFPAYDLLPVKAYGTSRYLFSPGGMTIHHSRGCISDCEFCSWWTVMAKRKEGEDGQDILVPSWRTKSVPRTIEEIKRILTDYGKTCLLFTDDSWNISSRWNNEFSEAILHENIKINWFAFLRSDLLLRDEKKGIVEKMVRSGLSHFCTGLEHSDQSVLDNYKKPFYSPNAGEKIIDIFKKKYPSVFLQTTFIVGHKEETKESIKSLLNYANNLKVDYPAFHILTPFPGTALHKRLVSEGYDIDNNYENYDLNTPIVSSEALTREDIAWEVYKLYKKSATLRWLLRGLLSRHSYKRRMYIWWFKVSWKVFLSMLKNKIFNFQEAIQLVEPKWYND